MGGACYAQISLFRGGIKTIETEESRRASELKLFRTFAAVMAAVIILSGLTATVLAAEQENTAAVLQKTTSEYTEVNEVVYAVESVNIRTGPSTSYSILSVLRTGASIRRVAVGSNGWSKVIYGGKTAYISSNYLSVTRPAGYTDNLDDTELKRQIAIANGLNRMDYTSESWAAMEAALDKACEAMVGNNQITADKAAEDLKNAISALVQMDYTALEAVLSDVEKMSESKPQHTLFLQLLNAAERGSALLTSGDQAAVDAAAAELAHLYAQLEAAIEGEKKPDVVVQEIPVEVPPTDDYCNIAGHRVWLVLFFLSLAVNVILVIVIAVYTSRKKRNQRDDTPLVDYDIYDDAL